MEIRDAEPADLPAVIDLHVASWRRAYRGLMPATFLDSGVIEDELRETWTKRANSRAGRPAPAEPSASRLFVALDDRLVGFAFVIPDTPKGTLLENLHVDPALWGRRIGTRLLRHAMSWAARTHPECDFWLEVYRGNDPAIAFYEHHGGQAAPGRTESFAHGFSMVDIEYTWPAAVLTA